MEFKDIKFVCGKVLVSSGDKNNVALDQKRFYIFGGSEPGVSHTLTFLKTDERFRRGSAANWHDFDWIILIATNFAIKMKYGNPVFTKLSLFAIQ